MLGIAELRVKETDRIKVMADGLAACGIALNMTTIRCRLPAARLWVVPACQQWHDHRIAMSFLTLGLVADAPITVTGCHTIETSFPGFASGMNALGVNIISRDET